MLDFCPNNVTFNEVWIDHAFSQCFFDTTVNAIAFIYICTFGLYKLRPYSVLGLERSTTSHSKCFRIQIALHLILPILEIIWSVMKASIVDPDSGWCWYMIVSNVSVTLTYMFALMLLMKECELVIPDPSNGHCKTLLCFWTLQFIIENLRFMNLHQQSSWWNALQSTNDVIQMVWFILKYVSCLLLFVLGLVAPGISLDNNYNDLNDASSINTFRSMLASPPNPATTHHQRGFLAKIRFLLSFAWPKKSKTLQLCAFLCFVMVCLSRVANLLIPIFSKEIVDELVETAPDDPCNSNNDFKWNLLIIYIALKMVQGAAIGGLGLLNSTQTFLWLFVQQHNTLKIQMNLFRHLHSLSLRWHLNRKSGEVLRVMDRGTDSINNLLSNILFDYVPTLIDIIVAVVYFLWAAKIRSALIVILTVAFYLIVTIVLTEWRTKFKHDMNVAENAAHAQAVNSLVHFETVKYYNAEKFEVDNYRAMIRTYQVNEWYSDTSLVLLNALQNVVITVGLLAGLWVSIHYLINKDGEWLTVGDYVMFSTYLLQLYMPLNWFGTYYRVTQYDLNEVDNLFDMMKGRPEVMDARNAGDLVVREGKIEFCNVTFSYIPEQIALKHVSFTVNPGRVVAIVGPSGAGKSTIMRLLFRLHDVDDGRILIDDQNIKTVRQHSLRQAIGFVPQETVLFNNTIKYNINYGRADANDGEIIDAARKAGIHKRIIKLPQEYETQVGERGLQLSRGEKQRIAIARTFLKDPCIVLLDEATSTLDTEWEQHIQAALNRVCKNRTTLIIAHRLSTIIHADQILVLNEGEIVERGTHEELINVTNGTYAKMWNAQWENELMESLASTSEQND